MVEWNETEGAIKRTYNGFRKRSLGVVQFDTTRNRFLAAGDEFLVKFWDMDNNNILTTTDCDGGLAVSIFPFFSVTMLTSFSRVIPVRAVCSGISPCRSVFLSSGPCSYHLPLWSSFLLLKSAEIEKVPANIYSMKRTAIWKYLQQISEQNYPQLLGKTKDRRNNHNPYRNGTVLRHLCCI